MADESKEVRGWRRAAIQPYLSCDDCGRPAPYFNVEQGLRACTEHVPLGIARDLSGETTK